MGTISTDMASLWWSSVTFFFVPAGIFFFILLSLPFRFLAPVRGLTVKVLTALSPVDGLNVATVFFTASIFFLYWEYMHLVDKTSLWAANQGAGAAAMGGHHAGQHWELLASKWRAERNMWIASMASFVWFAVWSLSVHVQRFRASQAEQEEKAGKKD